MKKIIALVGQIASGKGLASDYLIQKHNAGYYRFSTILRDIMTRLHISHSRENLVKTSEMVRGTFGQDILAKVMAEDVENDTAEVVIIDGVRRIPDIKYLKKLDGFTLVHITTNERTRYERIINRGENDGEQELTFKQFQKDNHRSTETTIAEVAAQATITIENNTTTEELQTKLDELL